MVELVQPETGLNSQISATDMIFVARVPLLPPIQIYLFRTVIAFPKALAVGMAVPALQASAEAS